MREGVTNKGGGLSRCAKGSQTRAGGYRAEERNKQTYKWTSKCTTKGAQRGQGVIVLREGVTNKGGGLSRWRKKQTNI